MTYKEACEILDEKCEDWCSKKNSFDLESTAYLATSAKNFKRLQDSFNSIFDDITNGIIKVTIKSPHSIYDSIGYLLIEFYNSTNEKLYGDISFPFRESERSFSKDTFINRIYNDMRYMLGKAVEHQNLRTTKDILKIVNYMYLTELDMLQSPLYDIAQEVIPTEIDNRAKLKRLTNEYTSWTSDVRCMMIIAGESWYEETTLVPGMKMSLVDLRTGEYSTRLIKSFSKKSQTPLIRFTDGSYIPADSDRISKLITWLLNNEKYKVIADALNIKK